MCVVCDHNLVIKEHIYYVQALCASNCCLLQAIDRLNERQDQMYRKEKEKKNDWQYSDCCMISHELTKTTKK